MDGLIYETLRDLRSHTEKLYPRVKVICKKRRKDESEDKGGREIMRREGRRREENRIRKIVPSRGRLLHSFIILNKVGLELYQ